MKTQKKGRPASGWPSANAKMFRNFAVFPNEIKEKVQSKRVHTPSIPRAHPAHTSRIPHTLKRSERARASLELSSKEVAPHWSSALKRSERVLGDQNSRIPRRSRLRGYITIYPQTRTKRVCDSFITYLCGYADGYAAGMRGYAIPIAYPSNFRILGGAGFALELSSKEVRATSRLIGADL